MKSRTKVEWASIKADRAINTLRWKLYWHRDMLVFNIRGRKIKAI